MPATTSEPESGLRMPAIKCRSVVLPEPLSPASTTCAFSARLKLLTLMTVCRDPSGAVNVFFNCDISSSGMMILRGSWPGFRAD